MATAFHAPHPPRFVWIKRLLAHSINAAQRLSFWPMRARAKMAGLMGHRLSAGTYIAERVHLAGSGLQTEGTVSFNAGCFIDAMAPIHIADGVRVGCEAMLVTTTHEAGTSDLRAGRMAYRPIRIGRGVWVGARATILPGVNIASGCVIASGAVVHQSTKANGLYAGVPARRVKDLHQ